MNNEELLRTLALIGAAVLLLVAFIAAVLWYIDLPEVAYSNATGKCAYVEYSDGSRTTCDSLPSHYTARWVR